MRKPWISALVGGALALAGAAGVGAVSAAYLSPSTAFGPITGSGNCSTSGSLEQPARAAADAQLAPFLAVAGRDTHATALFPDADVGTLGGSPYSLAFADTDVSVSIALHNMTAADAGGVTSTAPMSWGTPATGSDPDLLFGSTEQLQNCAPKPLRLVSTAEPGGVLASPTPYWNVTGFGSSIDQTTLDSALFTFSEPIDNFGAWFGDLETRADDVGGGDGGELGYLKLYDATGAVLAVEPIVPNVQTPIAPGTPFGCGGASNADASACGNHGTRFLGFTWDTPDVAAFQVIVGDDDNCNEAPSNCDGGGERFSFIGPTYAFDNPQLTFDKIVVNDNFGTATPGDFQFQLTADPNGAPVVTSHTTGDTVELQIGTEYAVSEVMAPGYTTTSVSCATDETSATGDIDVAVSPTSFTPTLGNSQFACTFTNDDEERSVPLLVTKTVVNDDGGVADAADFELTVSTGGSTTIVASGTTIDLSSPDEVSVGEVPRADYALTSVECFDAASTSIGATFAPSLAMAEITCTVTNDDIASTTSSTSTTTPASSTTAAPTTAQPTTTSPATSVTSTTSPAPPTTIEVPTGQLPATGGSNSMTLWFAMLAVVIGSALFAAARRAT